MDILQDTFSRIKTEYHIKLLMRIYLDLKFEHYFSNSMIILFNLATIFQMSSSK